MTAPVDVLIARYERPAALAVTLTSLCAQNFRDFSIVISDQSESASAVESGEVCAALRVLRVHGHAVETHRHLPRRGVAEQRQFLLDQARGAYAVFLDDDLILEPDVIARLVHAIEHERCGFVGQAVIGLSYVNDVRPHEQAIEFWREPVCPERVTPDSAAWARHRLHNAANLYHLQRVLHLPPGESLAYHIAWVGGCVLYHADKLRSVGGFGFWNELPPAHCGEDVLAQLRVMARYGGCGILPSDVYHQELPTTLPDRHVDAPHVLGIETDMHHGAH